MAYGGSAGIFLWSPSGERLLAKAFPTGLPGIDFVRPLDESQLMWTAAGGTPDSSRPVVWDVRDEDPTPRPFAPSFYSGSGWGDDQFAMTYFEPDQPIHTELWAKQPLADTGLRVATPLIATLPARGWLIGALVSELFVFDDSTGEILAQRDGFADLFRRGVFNADGTRLVTTLVPEKGHSGTPRRGKASGISLRMRED